MSGRSVRLLEVSTASPPHVLDLETCEAALMHAVPHPQLWRRVLRGARVRTRHTVIPLGELLERRSLGERGDDYARHAVDLGGAAAAGALAAAGVPASEIGTVLSVSCTGYMLPSLDAFLVARLGLPAGVRRIPLTELGCAGGIAALGIAASLTGGAPSLVVSVEPASLCLQVDGPDTGDLMGAVLFGDGAAAAVVAPAAAGPGPDVLGAASVLWPDSLGLLGMRLAETGFRFVLSPDLPRVVSAHLRGTVLGFLAAHGLALDDVGFWAVHPGGPKIMDAVAGALALPEDALGPSWEVWQRFGNMSSATVFFILREIAARVGPPPGSLGLVLALGPGVTCEMALLRAGGWLAGAGYSQRSASASCTRMEW